MKILVFRISLASLTVISFLAISALPQGSASKKETVQIIEVTLSRIARDDYEMANPKEPGKAVNYLISHSGFRFDEDKQSLRFAESNRYYDRMASSDHLGSVFNPWPITIPH